MVDGSHERRPQGGTVNAIRFEHISIVPGTVGELWRCGRTTMIGDCR